MKIRQLSAAAVVFFTGVLCGWAQIHWDGGPSGNGLLWNNAQNWVGDVLPSPDANVIFASTSTGGPIATPMAINGDFSCKDLTFNNTTNSFPNTLTIDTNFSGSLDRTLSLGVPGLSSINLITNVATTVAFRGANGNLTVALGGSGHTFNVDALGTLSFDDAVVIKDSVSATFPGGISKQGSGTLMLGSRNTFTGGVVLQQGTLLTYGGSIELFDSIVRGPFGIGTVNLQSGKLASSSTVGRTYHNNMVLSGNVTLGDTVNNGVQTFTKGTTTLLISGNITLTFDSDVIWDQKISEDVPGCGFTKAGIGTLTLNVENTFSGGVILQQGTLLSSHDGALGTGTLRLQSGKLASSSTAWRTYINDVQIEGDVTFGDAINTGVQTFTGGTTTLLSNATFTLQADVSWDQNITGDFRITKTGDHTLKLNGTNTYSGLTILAGTVTVTSESSISAIPINNTPNNIVLNGGKLYFLQNITATPLHANRGFALGNSGGDIEVLSNRTVIANGAFSNVEGETGIFTKTGPGTFRMAAESNTYTGATIVDAGTLLVDGELETSNVTVAQNATFGGTAIIGGIVTVDGTLAPGFGIGEEIGTLEINNNVTLGAQAQINMQLGSQTQFDRITGILNLVLDGEINVTLVNYNPTLGASFDLLDWASPLLPNALFNINNDLNLPMLTTGLQWDTSDFLTDGIISVVAVPEPGTMAFLGMGFGGIFLVHWALRRRRGYAFSKTRILVKSNFTLS